ncbi:MAG TPA: hypothetical protein VIK52_08525 [Opitutaceae bacterium]
MNTVEQSGITPRLWFWLTFAWIVIIAKCLMVPWVIAQWQIPITPGWVVIPTLLLAVVATMLLLARFHYGEPKG